MWACASARPCLLILGQAPSYISIRGLDWFDCPPQIPIDRLVCDRASVHHLLRHSHTSAYNVTTLVLQSVRTEDVANCLSWTPNITSLEIHPGMPNVHATLPTARIVLSRLEHFSLTQSYHNKFYASIVTPLLRSLILEPGASENLCLRQFADQTRTLSYLSFAGRVQELSCVHFPVPSFPPMRNITLIRMDVFLKLWREGDVNPSRLLALIKQHPHILPNLLEIHTNEVWQKNALDLLREMQNRRTQNPRLGLSIFFSCDSPATPIPRVELVESLVVAKVVRLFRQYN